MCRLGSRAGSAPFRRTSPFFPPPPPDSATTPDTRWRATAGRALSRSTKRGRGGTKQGRGWRRGADPAEVRLGRSEGRARNHRSEMKNDGPGGPDGGANCRGAERQVEAAAGASSSTADRGGGRRVQRSMRAIAIRSFREVPPSEQSDASPGARSDDGYGGTWAKTGGLA